MLTQENFHGAFQKLLERYNCIAAGGDYFEGDKIFMCVLSINVSIQKKCGNLFNDPRVSQANIQWIIPEFQFPPSRRGWLPIAYNITVYT